MSQTLRQAFRSLAKRPAFSLLIVLIMALCIGGNAAIFSAAKSVLIDGLPYPAKDRERLYLLSWIYRLDGVTNDLSWVEVVDWQKRATLIEDVQGFLGWQNRILTDGETAERIGINYVTPGYFKLLGVQPQLGRLFTAEDAGAPGNSPLVVLSDELWRRRYGADPQIVGRTVQANGVPYTVIGVMPAKYFDVGENEWPVDAWMPANMAGACFPAGNAIYEERDSRSWLGLARLKPGVTHAEAQKEIETIAAQMEKEFPDSNRDYTARLSPIRNWIFQDLVNSMKIVLAGALLVLLIGCGNIANLLLVRQSERQDELAMHLALGAGRKDLLRRILAESLLLSLAGGAAGVAFAVWGTRVLGNWIRLPEFITLRLDSGVLLFALAATLLTGLLFSLPAIVGVLWMEGKGTLQARRLAASGRVHAARTRNSLLVFQVAVVVMLLVVAGLLMRSFSRLRSTGVDFASDNVLTLRLAFETQRFTDRPTISLALRELVPRLERVPGIESVALWGTQPPGITAQYLWIKQGEAGEDVPATRTFGHIVSPGGLKTLGIPILRGRDFTPEDTVQSQRVAILTQSLAEALWPGQEALGKQLQWTDRPNEPWAIIIGIIPDTRLQGRMTDGKFNLLYSSYQWATRQTVLIARTRLDAPTMSETLTRAVHEVGADIPVFDVRTLPSRLEEEEAGHRFNATIVLLYSGLAVSFAVLGLYGLLSYLVMQRKKEIGVRMALGASRQSVMRLVMSRGLVLVGLGIALGIAGALALTRFLSTLLFGVGERDPLTFVVVTVLFLGIALLATYLPARKVLGIDPTRALRFD